jgi:hypothetical protein
MGIRFVKDNMFEAIRNQDILVFVAMIVQVIVEGEMAISIKEVDVLGGNIHNFNLFVEKSLSNILGHIMRQNDAIPVGNVS